MASNYSAWDIDAGNFSEEWPAIVKLQFFARYAVLAPSGHNTQPWHFSDEGDVLILKADHDRGLPYSGLQAKEPYVSLGTCLGTLQLAAEGFGYNVTIEYATDSEVIATIKLGSRMPADPSLLAAITHRVSNRSPYEAGVIQEDVLKGIIKPESSQVSACVISDKTDVAFIAEKTVEATHRIMSDKGFRAELSKWVRNNLTKQYDGMPGFVQGIPTPPSLVARHVIKNIDISKDQANKDEARILHSPYLLIIVVKDESIATLLDVGAYYAKICLRAEKLGYATSGLATSVIDPQTKQAVAKHFALSGQPLAIIRLGKATKPAKHTPRWPLAKVSD